MVTLGGGSGWGVLLDDRQMPTSGTRWAQAVKRACPHPAAQGRGGTSRRGEHPIKPSREAGKNVEEIPAIPLRAIPATM